MRLINRRTFYQARMKPDGTEYTLYTYEVGSTTDHGTDLIDSLIEYQEGDRVEVWFDSQYDKPKMKKYKEKRS